MIGIQGNKLLLFWQGVNIGDIENNQPTLTFKEYYQLENALYMPPGLSLREKMASNNLLLSQIEKREEIHLHELRNNPFCSFLCVSKKPTAEARDRQGYCFRISGDSYAGDFSFIKRLMENEFKVSQRQISRLFDVTDCIQIKSCYKTYPISGIGFYKTGCNQIRVQVYITNNRDTTTGRIHQLDFDRVCNNTEELLNGCGFECSGIDILKLIEWMYSKGMFCAFYGLDISGASIVKIKIYFRTLHYIDFDGFAQSLQSFFSRNGRHISLPRWETVQIKMNSRKRNYIDCITVAFAVFDSEIMPNGIQFYLAP